MQERALVMLDSAVLEWQRLESKKVATGMWLQLANADVDAEADDLSKLLMDERCRARRPDAVSSRGGSVRRRPVVCLPSSLSCRCPALGFLQNGRCGRS